MAVKDNENAIMDKQMQGDCEQLLAIANVGFNDEGHYFLLQNDEWGWAVSWFEEVKPDQIIEVAKLYADWGHAGLLYWVSEQNDQMTSEFKDVNRAIEFVRFEEELKKRVPDSDTRAYLDVNNPVLPTKTMWQRLKALAN